VSPKLIVEARLHSFLVAGIFQAANNLIVDFDLVALLASLRRRGGGGGGVVLHSAAAAVVALRHNHGHGTTSMRLGVSHETTHPQWCFYCEG